MKTVVIYPGRFQPMLKHHVDVYKALTQQFPSADVYFATSDKVELPKSPFSFDQKVQIAKAHGINPKKVINAKSPYNVSSYSQFDPDATMLIFAVGGKDFDRFPFNNLDPDTGLQTNKNGKPSYVQKLETIDGNPRPMSERGYITLVPNIETGGAVASASAFRDALQNAPDIESAKQIYVKQFGNYNEIVFNLIYNKILTNEGVNMNEELNDLRKRAGLPLTESPVDFENPELQPYDKQGNKDGYTELKPKEKRMADARQGNALGSDPVAADFYTPELGAKAGSHEKDPLVKWTQLKKSVSNRFPADQDPNDPATKKAMFTSELMRAPATLLGEINARLATDDNSLAVSDRLSSIMRKMDDGGVMQLPPEEKKFVFAVVANALKNMTLIRNPYGSEEDEELGLDGMEVESISFDDLRESYGVPVSGKKSRDVNHLGVISESVTTESLSIDSNPELFESFFDEISSTLESRGLMLSPEANLKEKLKTLQDLLMTAGLDRDTKKAVQLAWIKLKAEYADLQNGGDTPALEDGPASLFDDTLAEMKKLAGI